MTDHQLLPCPFCGGDAALQPPLGNRPNWNVVCRLCHCHIHAFQEKKITIEAWNTRAASPSIPEGWQPIETAPKDGTLIMLGNQKVVHPARYLIEDGKNYGWRTPMGGIIDHPTHWMPLPHPPQSQEGKK